MTMQLYTVSLSNDTSYSKPFFGTFDEAKAEAEYLAKMDGLFVTNFEVRQKEQG